jgi:Ca2+/Na+ antiporter
MSMKRRLLLQPASAATILGSDWVVDSLSWFFELEVLSRAALAGSIFCAVVVTLVESVTRPAAPGAALAKGALTGAIVLAPGPILGSAVALSALAWSAALYVAERSHRSRR